jgi:hypothetical protein
MLKYAVILCLLVLATPSSALARDKTDVVTMKNGDRFTCEIKGVRSGTLYLSFDYVIETISVDWSKVVDIESGRTFLLKTEDGSVYRGSLHIRSSVAAGPITIEVMDDHDHTTTLERSRVIRIDPIDEQFWQRFNGAISSDLNYSKGNQATQYNFISQTEYLRERWSAQIDFNSNLATSSGDTVSTRHQLTLYGRHLLPQPQYFWGGVLSSLHSSEQGIHLQTSLGGGIGRYFTNTNSASVSVIGGLALQRTSYDQTVFPLPQQQVSTALIRIDARLFRFNRMNVSLTANVFPAISDPGRVYALMNAYYFIKLFRKISWNVSAYATVDTQPPIHFSGSDYGTSSGLSFTFGNR